MKELEYKVKNFLKKSHVIVWLYEKVIECRDRFIWREHKVFKGKDNADKVFYVIRRKPGNDGLFSYVNTSLGLINYALGKGYIPVIDMCHTPNTYLEDDLVGKVNAWEYYFEQPCGYSVKDISKSRNIILCGMDTMYTAGYPGYKIIEDYIDRKKWRDIAHKYLKIKSDLLAETDILFSKQFSDGVLGVLCRGTDYISLRPSLHPVQPNVDEVIAKAREVLEEKKYKYIFLATEDEGIYQKFFREFGSMLLVTNAKRYICTERIKLAETKDFQNTNKYVNGKEYLQTIILLSKCKALIGGVAGGTYGAILLKQEEYDYEFYFKKGFYS